MRPTRKQLCGLSPSELKAFLRKNGHKVRRDFFKTGCVSRLGNRLYRWRWWCETAFVVDVSCPIPDFDRWANSIDTTRVLKEPLDFRRAALDETETGND